MSTVDTASRYPPGRFRPQMPGQHDPVRYDLDTVLGWRGRTVRDRDGDKIGKLGELFLDRDSDLPAWAGIHTGLFGTRESYVPLRDVVEDEDEDLRVPYDKATVTDAPKIDPERETLSEDEEQALFSHYGEPWRAHGVDEPREGEMIRSEEEPVVRPSGEGMQPVERVRLRKVLVTGEETRTIPVRKEEVRLETEPPPEGNVERVEDL